jgi:hypothetical protein
MRMPKKSKLGSKLDKKLRKKVREKVVGLADLSTAGYEEVHPDLEPEKTYEVRQIDYLAYNTLFSIQQLLNTLNLIADQQRQTLRFLSRIERKLDTYLIPEEDDSGDKGKSEDNEDPKQTDEVGKGGTTED